MNIFYEINISISYMKMHAASMRASCTADCCVMFKMCAATLFILHLAFHTGLFVLFPLLPFPILRSTSPAFSSPAFKVAPPLFIHVV